MGNRSSVWVSNSLREGLDQCHLFPVSNTGVLRKLMGYSHLQSFLHPVNLEDELLVKSGGRMDFPFVSVGWEVIKQDLGTMVSAKPRFRQVWFISMSVPARWGRHAMLDN